MVYFEKITQNPYLVLQRLWWVDLRKCSWSGKWKKWQPRVRKTSVTTCSLNFFLVLLLLSLQPQTDMHYHHFTVQHNLRKYRKSWTSPDPPPRVSSAWLSANLLPLRSDGLLPLLQPPGHVLESPVSVLLQPLELLLLLRHGRLRSGQLVQQLEENKERVRLENSWFPLPK